MDIAEVVGVFWLHQLGDGDSRSADGFTRDRTIHSSQLYPALYLASLHVIVSPIAVDEEIPKHHDDHGNCQGDVIGHEFRRAE